MAVDVNILYEMIKHVETHVDKMNAEFGMCQTDITWLKYSFNELLTWIRILVCGITASIFGTIFNLIISLKTRNTLKKNGNGGEKIE